VFPLWRADGKELFYVTQDGRVMSAEIKAGATFESGAPRQLFQTNLKFSYGAPYAPAPDGARFLVNTPVEADTRAPMIVVLNWAADLKR
jgi:hypothetical protein